MLCLAILAVNDAPWQEVRPQRDRFWRTNELELLLICPELGGSFQPSYIYSLKESLSFTYHSHGPY